MHIEFSLPTGAGGQAALYSCSVLNRELEKWSMLYGFGYTTEITYYKMTVAFVDERAYTHFALSWICPQVRYAIRKD
jgi:hypothetical protein